MGNDKQNVPDVVREAVIAMAEDGWLYFGPEGMSEAQEKCLAAYEFLTNPTHPVSANQPDSGKVREALEEARSVIASINTGKQHLVVLPDDRAYWQREEWCLWAINEVLPLIKDALASTSAPIAEGDE